MIKQIVEFILGKKFERHDIILIAPLFYCFMVLTLFLLGLIYFLLIKHLWNKLKGTIIIMDTPLLLLLIEIHEWNGHNIPYAPPFGPLYQRSMDGGYTVAVNYPPSSKNAYKMTLTPKGESVVQAALNAVKEL